MGLVYGITGSFLGCCMLVMQEHKVYLCSTSNLNHSLSRKVVFDNGESVIYLWSQVESTLD